MADTLSENEKKSKPKPLSRRKMILTTAAILLGNFSFGCSLSSISPALDSFRSKYGTTVEEISVVFTVSTILYCCGAIICGFISKYINRQLVVIFGLTMVAMSIYMTPYCPNKTMFFVNGGLLGFSMGLYDSSQMVWVIEIWQQKAGPFIQAQSLFYAIGSVSSSLIVAPFLDKFDHLQVNTTKSSPSERESTLHIPFLIMGTFNSLALLFQLLLFTFYRYHKPPMYANENFELIDDAKNVPSPNETELSGGNVSINQQELQNPTFMGVSSRKIKLVVISVLFLGAYIAMEVSTMQFLPTFGQYSNLKMSDVASAYVLTGLTGMFAFGRLIGTIIIIKVRPELIIVVNFVLIMIGNLILLIWASDNLTMFWLGSTILGTGFSTLAPSFCAFIEKYLVFTTQVASSIIVAGSIVSAIYPVIVGKFIEQRAVVLTYTNFFSTSVSIVAMIWGYAITRNSTMRER